MTKYLLAAVLSLTLAAAAPAADSLSGGLKAGLNISQFTGSDAGGDQVQRAGLIAGGYLVFPVQLAFKVQVEALISSKGSIYKWDVLGTPYESIIKLTYLEVPVLARFDFASRSAARSALLIGPSLGIKVSATEESRTVGDSTSGDISNIRTFDPGLVLGGVLDIKTEKGSVTLEARYTMGLSTIYEGSTDADVRNSAASIILGYKFR
ncbi:MAG: PorT family protein [Elusimicrobiales bacterium]|nr:PorT family protein [Elusimicrobiales bacterium]